MLFPGLLRAFLVRRPLARNAWYKRHYDATLEAMPPEYPWGDHLIPERASILDYGRTEITIENARKRAFTLLILCDLTEAEMWKQSGKVTDKDVAAYANKEI